MPRVKESEHPLFDQALNGDISAATLFEEAHRLLKISNTEQTHAFLELGHLPSVNQAISHADKINEWFSLLLQLIQTSTYNVGTLLRQRAERYKEKALFQTIHGDSINKFSFIQVRNAVNVIAGSLMNDKSNNSLTVGILAPNSIRGALVDLACLSHYIRVVPIPVNLSADHLNYVLQHSDITHLFLGGQKPYSLITDARINLHQLQIIHLDNEHPNTDYGIEWSEFFDPDAVSILMEPNESAMATLATIMYTSGTTDLPKGITFDQTNLISKRFARALALPKIGPADSFLCFLPLYHTFGRYFEMLGSLFWGATYTFSESTSFKALLKDFQIANPTIFISIPKRWIQIQEYVSTKISVERAPDEDIIACVQDVTGGNLSWGLSAAGYLDPDTFRFFHQNGIQLMSGYGMTEATGGITMTPPDGYVRESVGKVLPGIELNLGPDNELLMRGPYVSPGYYKDEESKDYREGWFHSGDIFKIIKGHYFIVDRKKEIYKNSRGQTISPQKIENLFQDFEAIRSVFLVGDGREYNTVLIYPEPENETVHLSTMTKAEIRTYFSSLVFSVNTFLPAYERIVNYAIIPRDFDSEQGELTIKGTYKRKIILKHFASVIKPMYEKNFISLIHNEREIQIPNWLLREKKLMRGDIAWNGTTISEYSLDAGLVCTWQKESVKIGDFTYHTTDTVINLEKLLRDPKLWLGNQALAKFVGNIGFRVISFEPLDTLQISLEHLPFSKEGYPDQENLKNVIRSHEPTLRSLHEAALISLSARGFDEGMAITHLAQALDKDTPLQILAQHLLLRLQHHPDLNARLKVLEILLPHITGEMFIDLYTAIHHIAQACEIPVDLGIDIMYLIDRHCQAILRTLANYRLQLNLATEDVSLCHSLMKFLSLYGIQHPTWYTRVRAELVWWQQTVNQNSLTADAQHFLSNLTKEFRTWLGTSQRLAIDKDTGQEYTWSDVVLFDEQVPKDLQERLIQAMAETTLVREAVFLFSGRHLIHLGDIQLQGVWVTFLGKAHGKSVVRILIQTREMEAFNMVINLNEEMDIAQLGREINWLIITGSSIHGPKLVEDFGGYWPDHNLYTEEYIPGETVQQYLDRNQVEIETGKYPDRWQMRWLHFIWNGMSAYLEFWKRTGCTLMVGDASIRNLIIPEYDYAVGTRIISISERKQEPFLVNVLTTLYRQYVLETEKLYSGLRKMAGWEILFTTVCEVFGRNRGLELIHGLAKKLEQPDDSATELNLTRERVLLFLDEVRTHGLLIKQVVFASLRYHRWLDLNQEATQKARGTIIQELYKDYDLGNMTKKYPDTRMRFFLMTAFRDSNPILIKHLTELMNELRQHQLTEAEFSEKLHLIHQEVDLNDNEQFFLTRLVYEHVDAADYAELISREIGRTGRLDLVVLIEDDRGEQFRIRPPFHPKEVARFHRLLQEANLPVRFRVHHEFLMVIDKKEHLAGGVFWKQSGPGIAHLEKVVIAPQYRRGHLSVKLVEEFFNRLRLQSYEHLTVGFFQAGFFYKLGFQIDKKYGGLVKHL